MTNLRKPLDVEHAKYHLMYLPYDVDVWVPHCIWSGNPPEPSHEEMGADRLTFEGMEGFCQHQLILRPLSDLDNEITVNNETFVPLTRLSNQFNYNWTIIKDVSKFIQDTKYSDIEKLKEWNFDFLGLIDEDIAINMHQLDEKRFDGEID